MKGGSHTRLNRLPALASALVLVAQAIPAPAMQLPDHADTSARELPVSVLHVGTRELYVEEQIVEALDCGRLSLAQAEGFKAELDRIVEREDQYRSVDGTMSAWENIELNSALDRLERAVEHAMRARSTGSLDLRGRLERLDRVITDAVGSGRLNAADAGGLRSALEHVWGEAAEPLAPVDSAGQARALKVSADLDAVSRDLQAKMGPRAMVVPDLDANQARIGRRIKDGALTGQLTGEEASDLTARLDELARVTDQVRAQSGGVKPEEALKIAIDLQELDRLVSTAMSNAKMSAPSIADCAGIIDSHIKESLASGRLAGSETDELRDELRRIVKVESAFDREGELTAAQKLTLAGDLDRLNRAIDKPLNERLVAWSGIEEREADLNRRIGRGLVCGRLTPEQARDFWLAYHSIVDAGDGKGGSGALTFEESATMALALDRLRSKVEASFAGEQQRWPGLDGQKRATSARIGLALAGGQIDLAHARRLSADLGRSAHAKATLRTAHGSLSADEAIALAADLERINSGLDRLVTARSATWSGLEERRRELEAKVSSAMKAGKLNQAAAAGMQQALIRVSDLGAGVSSARGGLGLPGAMAAASELERVGKQVDGSGR